uniref:Uncharacterized protein n=1 Tax=Tanacetum cinerariifolium TaxID=118510 RepID=A0A6L2JB13_TANCI|nr:hypothetical protein [Tanacetum cinerariifolium]
MPIELNKPPDPLIAEFKELTGMTADRVCDVVVGNTKDGGGKRFDSIPVDVSTNRVLHNLKFGPTNGHLKFSIGSNIKKHSNCDSVKRESMAKSSGPLIGFDCFGMGVGSKPSGTQSSLMDGITISKTNMVNDKGMAGGEGFESGKKNNSNGILKKPEGPFFLVQFGKNVNSNPFVNKSSMNTNNGWNSNKGNKFGPSLFYKNSFDNVWIPNSKAVNADGTSMDYRVVNVLNAWEPNIWLEKVEPSTIPIWVCVYNIPMELYNGNRINKIMGGVGKTMLMDKMIRERCLKKSSKLYFARVLVKPLLCTHCKTFGYSTLACKLRPRFVEEISSAGNNGNDNGSGKTKIVNNSNDGFVTVDRKNKPVKDQSNVSHVNYASQQNRNFGSQSQFRDNQYVKMGNTWQNRGKSGPNSNNKGGNSSHNVGKKKMYAGGVKNVQQVLVRGSNSKINFGKAFDESVPVTNSFQALDDHVLIEKDDAIEAAMEEEYSNIIEPLLVQEVIDVMSKGAYPSADVRLNWSLFQISFFYNNCHKYGLNPSVEDDDIKYENGGMADELRPE